MSNLANRKKQPPFLFYNYLMIDLFPPSEFDQWADSYDQDVVTQTQFPFDGYENVIETVVHQADARQGMHVLDIGTGTANLALRFADLGCELWCTDFSEPMLEKARQKLPEAHFFRHDFRREWPPELEGQRFDRIVSAYVFHHVELHQKVQICEELVKKRIKNDGKLVIADLSFPTRVDKEKFKNQVSDWEEEPYWIVDQSIQALEKAGLKVEYWQVSACAGVYTILA
jgi:putative AdoMet-dependent methyltransferase